MRHLTPTGRRRLAAGLATATMLLGLSACADSSSDGGAAADDQASAAVSDAPEGTFEDNAATGAAIKIGIISPEGGTAISQPEGRVAAEAAVAYANANLGGIACHKIEAVVCKEKEDAASATDCANQMVEQDVAGVVVLNTAQGDSMAPIITGAGIAYTGYNGTSGSELTGDPAFIWTGAFPGVLGGMAKYAATNAITKLTLFVTDSPQVVGAVDAMGTPAFDAAGVKLTVTPIPPGTPDATSQVTAGIKDDPEAIAIVGDATVCTSALKALGTVGYKGTKLVITPCLDPSTVEAAGDVLDGAKLLTTTDASGDDDESKLYRAVMGQYAAGEVTTGAAQSGFQSMLGFIRAAQGVQGDPTAASIVDAIRSAKDVPVPLAHGATMTCDGTAVPGLTALCSSYNLVGTLDATGTPSGVELLG
ncbi:ABC transporter substrate-binding protein [soil metagenome]